MALTISENISAEAWDKFVSAAAADGGLLQSWNWGQLQESLGRKIFRLAVLEGEKIVATALIVKHRLPLGQSYLYAPRGPVINSKNQSTEVRDFLFNMIKKCVQSEGAIFLRLDPPWTDETQLQELGSKKIGEVQPAQTLIVDLQRSETDLLKQMKPKTRYNIKVAEKHGIEVKISKNSESDFEEFWRMMVATSARDGIKSHSKRYYQQMLRIGGIKLALARWQGRACAGNIMAYFGKWCIYLHGASDYDMRDKMAPYSLQWQLIKDAKKNGFTHYDFWGANPDKWPGVTRFKQGFAPAQPLTKYIGAYDVAYRPIGYFFYRLVKKVV